MRMSPLIALVLLLPALAAAQTPSEPPVTTYAQRPSCAALQQSCALLQSNCSAMTICPENPYNCSSATACSDAVDRCNTMTFFCLSLIPTPVPTLEPTPLPTPIPTENPDTRPNTCQLTGTTTLATDRDYNSTGPGTVFTIPNTMMLNGFSLSMTYGPGIRCGTSPFNKPTYFGCWYPDKGGYAEFVLDGVTSTSPVLIPSDGDVYFRWLHNVTGTAQPWLYNLTNCNWHFLQPNFRASMNTYKLFAPGRQLSVWHSEALYQFAHSDNSGGIKMNIYGNLHITPAPTPVPSLEPTRVPTYEPTVKPTPLPTVVPTREPTRQPVVQQCNLAGTRAISSAMRIRHTPLGPGPSFVLPSTINVRAFVLEYKGGGGMRCYNVPWTPLSYFGCQAKTGTTSPVGYAEMLVLGDGLGTNNEILFPYKESPAYIPVTTIPGNEDAIHLYAVANCPFPTKLSLYLRWNLPATRTFTAGTRLSLWHSEAYYGYSLTDNAGYSDVQVYYV